MCLVSGLFERFWRALPCLILCWPLFPSAAVADASVTTSSGITLASAHFWRRSAQDPGTVELFLESVKGKFGVTSLRINDDAVPPCPPNGSIALWTEGLTSKSQQLLVTVRLSRRTNRFLHARLGFDDGTSLKCTLSPQGEGDYPLRALRYDRDGEFLLVAWTGVPWKRLTVDGAERKFSIAGVYRDRAGRTMRIYRCASMRRAAGRWLIVIQPEGGSMLGFRSRAPEGFVAQNELLIDQPTDLDLGLFPKFRQIIPRPTPGPAVGGKGSQRSWSFETPSAAPADAVRLAMVANCAMHRYATFWEAGAVARCGQDHLEQTSWHSIMHLCRVQVERGVGLFGGLTDCVRINPHLEIEHKIVLANRCPWLVRIGQLCRIAHDSVVPGRLQTVVPIRNHPYFSKRPPTAEELRVMVATCLANGSQGILYRRLPRSKCKEANDIRKVNQDLQALAPLLSLAVPIGGGRASKSTVEVSPLACGPGKIVICVIHHGITRPAKDSPEKIDFPEAGPFTVSIPYKGSAKDAKVWEVLEGQRKPLRDKKVEKGELRVLVRSLRSAVFLIVEGPPQV